MANHSYEVIIIGAGAAGLMCAWSAAQRGRKVLLLEHGDKAGKKILISGGGRCNFTNLYTESDNYISENPYFAKSALSRYTQYDFMALLDKYKIAYEEKKLGQLFCVGKAKQIVDLFLKLCQQAGVTMLTHCQVDKIYHDKQFYLKTSNRDFSCESLVIATGGLSIPKMGATDFGLKIAKQFHLNIIPPKPALVPLCLDKDLLNKTKTLAGISVESVVSCNGVAFRENILFTHKGLSGPAILQISNYWNPGYSIEINLLPNLNLAEQLKIWQQQRPKAELKTLLSEYLSKRMVQQWLELFTSNKTINQYSNRELEKLVQIFQHWQFIPSGSEGYRTAEVTKGGVDCNELSSKTFATKKVSGLYFIGEVLDVTGWLGGYNFQWAWSSGYCAGQYV